MLKIDALCKRFGATNALDRVSLTLAGGEICGLVGHNGAGKSTLIKIIAGAMQPDGGELSVDEKVRQFATPHQSYEAGIRVVHQDAPLVPRFDSIENCFLGRPYPRRFGVVDRGAMEKTISRFAGEIAPDLPLDVPVAFLRPAQKQFVRLLKAVSDAGRMLVLDEPTAALPAEDAEIFFDMLKRLRARGTAILLVSHRLDEIAGFCDRAIVLRDGRRVADLKGSKLSVPNLIAEMGGGGPAGVAPPKERSSNSGQKIFQASGLCAGELKTAADFDLRAGEVVTLYGLSGSGRSSFLQAIWGSVKSTGTMTLAGKPYAPKSPVDAVRAGLSYVPADRHRTGLFKNLSLVFNKTISLLEKYRRFPRAPLPDQRREKQAFLNAAKSVFMTFGHEEDLAGTLSGGNQQKLLFSRWADRHSTLMLLDEPTEGIDVKARATIKQLIRAMADDGAGVLISTSDRDEALEMGDRMAIFRDGALVKVLSRKEASPDKLALWAQAKIPQEKAPTSETVAS